MKTNLLFAAFAVLGLCMSAWGADAGAKEAKESKGVLYHVVCLKFKDGTAPEQIKAVEDAFLALKSKVPGVTSLQGGTNVSPEKRNQGFTHCFVVEFASDADRDAYLTHPEHKAFGKLLGPVMADVLVVDFWAKE